MKTRARSESWEEPLVVCIVHTQNSIKKCTDIEKILQYGLHHDSNSTKFAQKCFYCTIFSIFSILCSVQGNGKGLYYCNVST